MARRISASQLRNKIRQAQAKQKRAIDNYNRAARDYNSKLKRAVGNYNQAVRSHNSKVRTNRQRIERELANLKRSTATGSLTRVRTSSQVLHKAFIRVESRTVSVPANDDRIRFFDLSEQETANSLAVLNALSGQTPDTDSAPTEAMRNTMVTTELSSVSQDLDMRWRGALYALSPDNPDATRHFCTSAREIFTRFLEMSAPDAIVFKEIPASDTTQDGRPTRRSRIKMLLGRKGMVDEELEDFVTRDVDNILDLFGVFNDGTHGSAGKFAMHELAAVKKRVEDGIMFLASIAR